LREQESEQASEQNRGSVCVRDRARKNERVSEQARESEREREKESERKRERESAHVSERGAIEIERVCERE